MIMASSYFEAMRSKATVRKHKHKYGPLYRRGQHELPSASGWSTRELFASRVIVRHVRGGVLKYPASSPPSSVFLKPPPWVPNAELFKVIAPVQPGSEGLTETELVHQLGGTAGMFWAALHRFTRAESVQAVEATTAGTAGATVQLASTFLRHALIHCPLQRITAIDNPPQMLLEFSGMRRRMFARLGDGALELEATADGEIIILRRNAMGRFVAQCEVLALLEAKKRLKLIREGRPIITDDVFGQMVGEALALMLVTAELDHRRELVSAVRLPRVWEEEVWKELENHT